MLKLPDLLSGRTWLKICLYIKDNLFTGSNEHLYRAVRLAKEYNKEKNAKEIIIDAGCYDGKTTLFLSKMFPECKVIGFEPNKDSFESAEKNTNGKNNIKLFPFALSSEESEKILHITHNQVSGSLFEIDPDNPAMKKNSAMHDQLKISKKERVHVKTLDSFGFAPVLILKMDTQGNELDLLKGAVNTLKRTLIVVTELSVHKLYKGGCSYYETDAFLRSFGFEPVDFFIPYRKNGVEMTEFDGIYLNRKLSTTGIQ